mmetsp:Transcript_30321/g.34823  ORF Transcript_30321/g.34823 Transcript_30321/m.34823 type:complete len:214 (+) Transcript_30321:252-893(+)
MLVLITNFNYNSVNHLRKGTTNTNKDNVLEIEIKLEEEVSFIFSLTIGTGAFDTLTVVLSSGIDDSRAKVVLLVSSSSSMSGSARTGKSLEVVLSSDIDDSETTVVLLSSSSSTVTSSTSGSAKPAVVLLVSSSFSTVSSSTSGSVTKTGKPMVVVLFLGIGDSKTTAVLLAVLLAALLASSPPTVTSSITGAVTASISRIVSSNSALFVFIE